MGNIRVLPWVKLVASVAALAAIVAGVIWVNRSLNDDPEEEFYGYFLRDVATAQAQGVPVYWLGREFTVDGLVFRGPHVAGFGAEVEGGGVDMSYLLEGGNSRLELTIYGRDAWARVEDRMMNPSLRGVTRKTVTVGGREGVLFLLPLGSRPLNVLRCVLDLRDIVVVATAHAGGAVYPGGPDYNPFINNPDLLVQVMQDLRPYPE